MLETSPSLFSRRSAIGILTACATVVPAMAIGSPDARRVDAIAFDGFPIFDPRSITALAKRLVPDRGEALAQAWTTKLFGYTWLYTAAGQYAGFEELADRALRFTADMMGLALTDDVRERLVGAYAQLDIWPDVERALGLLKDAGIRLAFLSNLGEPTLRANMERNGIAHFFDHVLSTDRVRHFKPSPAAYAMAVDAFRLPKSRIGFAAFGGWDAGGAAWFGYPTAWVNRLGVARERLDPGPTFVARGMSAVLMLAGIATPAEGSPGDSARLSDR